MTTLRAPSPAQLSAIKAAVFALCCVPAVWYVHGLYTDALGANPIEAITKASGSWTLRFLLITLAVTPLRKLTGLNWLLRLRRMLGLFTFAYASLHFATYIWLDQFFDWGAIAADIVKRPFITVGFTAFVLLIPLALTSNNYAIRGLGGRRWQSLHRSVYAIGILAIVHYWWLVKADISQPLLHASILAVLLGLRAWWREAERRRQLSTPPRAPAMRGKVIPIVSK